MCAMPIAGDAPRRADVAYASATRTLDAADAEFLEVSPCGAGDHGLVFQLMLASGAQVSLPEFQSQLDAPGYAPGDRLLAWLGRSLVAHLQIVRRQMAFGQADLPAAEIRSAAILPEFSAAPFRERLLTSAEEKMRSEGAVIAVLKTRDPARLARLGWISCGPPRLYRASARGIRAHLAASSERGGNATAAPPISTRMWRHVELQSLVELYAAGIVNSHGPYARDEDFWQWLVGRHGYDRLIVAIEGEDTLDFGAGAPKIVGYLVMRQQLIAEAFAERDRPDVIAHLLARACREAIEADCEALLVCTAPHSDQHACLKDAVRESGGVLNTGANTEVTMVKLLDVGKFLQRIQPQLIARAARADAPLPLVARLRIGGETFELAIGRRSIRLTDGGAGRADAELQRADFQRLVLGQLDLTEATSGQRAKVRSKRILSLLETLFPRRPLSWPGLDDLPAMK